MEKKLKLGILRETKSPPDRRVTIAPQQGIEFVKQFPDVELLIQPSDIRAYSNQEYLDNQLTLQDDLSDCDILVGVKEVDIQALMPDKTYMFFSHTGKKQSYNRKLLQKILKKNIRLIDYEYLTDIHEMRLVAFGRWAGIVGAYNGLLAHGKKTGIFSMRRAHECVDMDEFFAELMKIKLPPLRILITGGGRVAHGAIEVLSPLNIRKISPHRFLNRDYEYPVYCQLDPWHYTKRKDGDIFDFEHFIKNPFEYDPAFLPYTKRTDLFIACHFWDPQSPVFMTANDMKADDFSISIIADVSCDIKIPIPSTLRASSIAEPYYDYNPISQKEEKPFSSKNNVTVMAVDNLPGEAPRNASIDFGKGLIKKVFPSLLYDDKDEIIKRATITENGKLTDRYAYLQDYVDGKE
jgi:alanine dehydrogenase